jgi:hypothetical protein
MIILSHFVQFLALTFALFKILQQNFELIFKFGNFRLNAKAMAKVKKVNITVSYLVVSLPDTA